MFVVGICTPGPICVRSENNHFHILDVFQDLVKTWLHVQFLHARFKNCMQFLQLSARIAGNSIVMLAKIAPTTKILACNYFRRSVVDGGKIIACKNCTCNHSFYICNCCNHFLLCVAVAVSCSSFFCIRSRDSSRFESSHGTHRQATVVVEGGFGHGPGHPYL